MKVTTAALISDLIARTNVHIQQAEKWMQLSSEVLNWKENAERWSVLECLEHLNLYGDFYIPEISQRIKSSKHSSEAAFSSGILGNYFAKSMLPKEQLNTMNTFKNMNPIGSQLDKKTITRFLDQQRQLLALLEKAKTVSLTKTKTSISISKWISLKLGDTFRVVIYHNERHIVQAQKVLALNSKSS